MERTGVAPGAASESAPFRLGYQPGLDGLRGIAVVMIMMFHTFIIWPRLYGDLMPGAYITVNIFFVLSGFLITSLLLQEHQRHGRISFKRFYERRALRLLPALFFMLGIYLVYQLVSGQRMRPHFIAAGWITIYVANWARWADKFDSNTFIVSLGLGHAWTLSVEEQFYIVWPIIVLAVLRTRARVRTIAWSLGALVVLVGIERWLIAARVVRDNATDTSLQMAGHLERLVGIRTDLRFDTLLLGALAAWLLHAGWRPGRSWRWAGAATVVALVLVSLFVQPDSHWMYEWGFTFVNAGAALLCVVVLGPHGLFAPVFAARPSAWLGRMSYALYLWHPVVFVFIIREFPTGNIGLKIMFGWVLTFAFASLSYYCVEKPFLRLKDRRATRTPQAKVEPVPSVSDIKVS